MYRRRAVTFCAASVSHDLVSETVASIVTMKKLLSGCLARGTAECGKHFVSRLPFTVADSSSAPHRLRSCWLVLKGVARRLSSLTDPILYTTNPSRTTVRSSLVVTRSNLLASFSSTWTNNRTDRIHYSPSPMQLSGRRKKHRRAQQLDKKK